MADPAGVPDPALVVLVGASGSGKSSWAAQHYLAHEVVSSDDLRAVVGSGRHDLAASADAFDLLERVVAARLGRGLTTVVDTLGLDAVRRRGWLERARAAGLPARAVVLATAPELCRARNRGRDRPVPAAVLTGQLRAMRTAPAELAAEGWPVVTIQPVQPGGVDAVDRPGALVGPRPAGAATPAPTPGRGPAAPELGIVLQVSRFPWGADPVGWLTSLALAAQQAGCEGIALMDHLIQIPQVGRDWEDVPEPFVTLGLLAGAVPGLRLGTLVSPLSLRAPGLLAKAVATLDVLCGGRAFCGVGAGWWAREHAAYGVDFGPPGQRVDQLAAGIEQMKALWRKGTRAYDGDLVHLPETTCYPRPVGPVPVIVGGRGPRMLDLAGRLGDACNLPADPAVLVPGMARVRASCRAAGRAVDDVAVTVLDVPVIGRDRQDVAARVERLRGRTPAASYAAAHHAGTAADQVARYRELAALGVSTVFVALPDLDGPADLERLAPVVTALR